MDDSTRTRVRGKYVEESTRRVRTDGGDVGVLRVHEEEVDGDLLSRALEGELLVEVGRRAEVLHLLTRQPAHGLLTAAVGSNQWHRLKRDSVTRIWFAIIITNNSYASKSS